MRIAGARPASPRGAPGSSRSAAIWFIGWFGYLNYILMLCNLIPALPFDGGRMLRAYLASTSVVSTRESIAAPWTAHAFAVLLGFIGLARLALFQQYDGLTVIGLALLVELLVRTEAQNARRRRLLRGRRLRIRFLGRIHQPGKRRPQGAAATAKARSSAGAAAGPSCAASAA